MNYNFQEATALLNIAPQTLAKWSIAFAPLLSATEQQIATTDTNSMQRRYTDADIAVLNQVKVLLATKLSYAEVCLRLKIVHFSDVTSQTFDVLSKPLQAISELSLDANALIIETTQHDASANTSLQQSIPTLFNQLPPELQDELDQLRPDTPKALPSAEQAGLEPDIRSYRTPEPDEHAPAPGPESPQPVVDAPMVSSDQRNGAGEESRATPPLPEPDQRPISDAPQQPAIFAAAIRSKTVLTEGMLSTIYKVIDERGDIYAVEEIPNRFTQQQERLQAYERCAVTLEALQNLSHPRIPRVYGWFSDPDHVAVVMDAVGGQSLAAIAQQQGALPEWQVLEWANQICEALEHLHTNRIIHGDITPENVIVGDHHDGITLLSLGIAPALQPESAQAHEPRSLYEAPEQQQGVVTRASDIYALGATLYYLLTGYTPASAASSAVPAVRELQPSVSARTSEIIQRALQVKPKDRFPSVETFRAALLLNQFRASPQVDSAPVLADEVASESARDIPPVTPPREQSDQDTAEPESVTGAHAPATTLNGPAAQVTPLTQSDIPLEQPAQVHQSNVSRAEQPTQSIAPDIKSSPLVSDAHSPEPEAHAMQPGATEPNTQSAPPEAQTLPSVSASADAPLTQTPLPIEDPTSVTEAEVSTPAASGTVSQQPSHSWEPHKLETLVARSHAASAGQSAPRRRLVAGGLGRTTQLVWIGIAACIVAVVLFFAVIAPGRSLQPTPTPQTFIAQSFTLENVKVIVAAETGDQELRSIFVYAFTDAAQRAHGAGVRIDETTLAYIGGLPQKISEDSQGIHYRGTITGTILKPRE